MRGTYSGTGLTRWTWVSWEADGTLQTERDNKTLSCTACCVTAARTQWAVQTRQRPSCAIQLTYRVTLWTVISRRSSGAGGSSSSRWASISLLTRLSSEALSTNISRVRTTTANHWGSRTRQLWCCTAAVVTVCRSINEWRKLNDNFFIIIMPIFGSLSFM